MFVLKDLFLKILFFVSIMWLIIALSFVALFMERFYEHITSEKQFVSEKQEVFSISFSRKFFEEVDIFF